MGLEICPFCPETRLRSAGRQRLVPRDLLAAHALPSGLETYARMFYQALCAEITITVGCGSPKPALVDLHDAVSPREGVPYLERWRAVPFLVLLDPRAGLLLLSCHPRAVRRITGGTAGMIQLRGELPTEEEHAAVMEEHAEAIRGRLRAVSLSDVTVAVALHLARPLELPTIPAPAADEAALWGEQPRTWRYCIVKSLGGLRSQPLSVDEQQAVLAATRLRDLGS